VQRSPVLHGPHVEKAPVPDRFVEKRKRRDSMSMMLREPFEAITPLREVMNRLMEESFVWPERVELSAARAFSLDIRESEDKQQYIVEANLAGFKPEEIEITSSGDTITIHAAKKGEEKSEKGGYVRRERYVGEMSRTITLPSHVDADKIQASYDQGVLTLRIPKAEAARPRQIPVQTTGH
jgi:HSP20 family protein